MQPIKSVLLCSADSIYPSGPDQKAQIPGTYGVDSVIYVRLAVLTEHSWASAHRCNWGQLTPWKMDEKLKSEENRAVFYVYVIFREQSGQAGVENGAMLTTFIQIYFRMHHFLVKFSSPQAARGH